MMSPREFVQCGRMSGFDVLFDQTLAPGEFLFDEQVVAVFPNMIERSVPDYWTLVDGLGRLGATGAPTDSVFYDLGCSLGAVAWSFYRHNGWANPIVAMDSSVPMMRQFKKNMTQFGEKKPISLRCEDIRTVSLEGAGVVSLNLTLQFLDPADRLPLLSRIGAFMRPGGRLLLTEKIRFEDPELDALVVALHHQFKRDQGYSALEVAQKATAIQNVMQIETLATHRQRLAATGFSEPVVWHQHYNFVSMVVEWTG